MQHFSYIFIAELGNSNANKLFYTIKRTDGGVQNEQGIDQNRTKKYNDYKPALTEWQPFSINKSSDISLTYLTV